jgi:glycosyltransferase involved in cell wall biosynthesis
MKLGLVVPSYRDCERLSRFLPELCSALSEIPEVEILVVDDGSGEAEATRTRLEVENLRAKYPILKEPLLLEKNVGKGGAIYAGWRTLSQAEWLGFVDADGATPAYEVARVIRMVLENSEATDAYIASRIKLLGRNVNRSIVRHFVGRVFATISSIMTRLPVYDSQCGCKFVRRSAYEKTSSMLRETRFAFDVELLVYLDRTGATIREIPVDWSDIPGSKVSIVKDGLKMLIAVRRLRNIEH